MKEMKTSTPFAKYMQEKEQEAGLAVELAAVGEFGQQRLGAKSGMPVPEATDLPDTYLWLQEANPEAIILEGFQEAYIGVGERFSDPGFAVYDYERCLGILVAEYGATGEAAIRYLHYHLLGADHGPASPAFVALVHVPPDQFEADPQCVYHSLADANPLAKTAIGLESAYLGIGRRAGCEPLALYGYDACIDILMAAGSESPDEARDHLDYNVLGSYHSPHMPVFVSHMCDQVEKAERPLAETHISLRAVRSDAEVVA